MVTSQAQKLAVQKTPPQDTLTDNERDGALSYQLS